MKSIAFNKLIRGDSFLQVNFYKGYKYIDKAGEILNSYVNKKNYPLKAVQINVNELIIPNPHPNIEVLKVSHQMFWMHFTQSNLDLITFKRIFEEELNKINNIINFEHLTRIGWRNYFIYEFINEKQKDKAFQKLQIINNTDIDLYKFFIKNSHIKANVLIQKIKRNDDEKKLGLLFDIDAYEEGENKASEISNKLNDIYNFIKNQQEYIINEIVK